MCEGYILLNNVYPFLLPVVSETDNRYILSKSVLLFVNISSKVSTLQRVESTEETEFSIYLRI